MKLGVVGIIIEGDRKIATSVNGILSDYGDLIIGRIGIPSREDEIYLISVAVKGTAERISAMTGKLGRLNGVTVKAAVTNVEIGDEEPRKE